MLVPIDWTKLRYSAIVGVVNALDLPVQTQCLPVDRLPSLPTLGRWLAHQAWGAFAVVIPSVGARSHQVDDKLAASWPLRV